jgi:hypothetical protein
MDEDFKLGFGIGIFLGALAILFGLAVIGILMDSAQAVEMSATVELTEANCSTTLEAYKRNCVCE